MAWKVPWMSEATNEGKSMALSVARVTSPTRPVGVAAGAPPPAGAGDAGGAPGAGWDDGAGEDDDGVRREARSLPASCVAYGASGLAARYSAMRDIESLSASRVGASSCWND